MNRSEAKTRVAKLRDEINHHRYLYHVLDKQEISEAALDSLKKELFDLEQQYPDLVTPDSPTQRVGGEVASGFKKVQHSSRMLSLNDAFDENDLNEWVERLKRFDAETAVGIDFYVEPKVDGLAISLIYIDGRLQTAATRGNGLIGEDVTHAIKTIESVPLALNPLKKSGTTLPERVEVRGEVYLSKKDFDAINKEREKNDLPLYMNPRNTAAGSVRQLDPKLTASRNLKFIAYSLPVDLGQKTHEQEHELLQELGFRTDPLCTRVSSITEVMKLYEAWQKKREKLTYQIDGMVVVVNDNAAFAEFGVVGKAPRGAIAMKFPAEQVTTIVEDIQVQVGRTGVLTPVAHLQPVRVAGTIVKRATLHNLDEVRRLDIRVGDTVIIEKAGDIIPDVVEVLVNLRAKKALEFQMPKTCPVCETTVIQHDGEVAYVCPNKECPAKVREQLYYFVGKSAFDIDGLGPAIIDQLMDSALVATAADIFRLKTEDLLPLERFAEKSAENTIAAIQARRTIPLSRFIISLGIKHVGVQTAVSLAEEFETLKNLRHATREDLEAVEDIGPTVADSIIEYLEDPAHQHLIDDLVSFVTVEPQKKVVAPNGPLTGKSILFTGTLETMTRSEAQEKARALGADIESTVTKNLSILVVGDKPGSKLTKAQKLGAQILTEQQFLKILGQ
jgi:DNA ligase (NAD+)